MLLPATPGWVSLSPLVGVPLLSWLRAPGAVPRHSWLGSAGGGGVWCVVCGVWCVVCGSGVLVGLWLVCGVVGPSPLLAELPVCYSPPLLAGFRCRWWSAVLATPGRGSRVWFPTTLGWGPLAAPVCGVWCVVCGGGVLVGLWLVCGVVGPSPLLAEVPACYSPPLLAGLSCRWWWAFLATPGSGSRLRFPATSGWVSLSAVVGAPRHSLLRVPGAVPRHSWLGSAGGGGVWCVVCCVWCVVCGGGVLVGLWLVCGLVGLSPLLAEVPVCYSPPLLAWFRCWWWRAFLATPGGGSRVRFPATPGWVSLLAVVCGVWCVVCGVWCAAVVCWWGCGWCVVWLVPRHSWRRFLCATPRHSWLGFAAGGGGRSSPLQAEGPGRGSPPLLAGVRWRRWCLMGLWLVCGVVGPSPLLAEVPVCYPPPLPAGLCCRWWWAFLATPG